MSFDKSLQVTRANFSLFLERGILVSGFVFNPYNEHDRRSALLETIRYYWLRFVRGLGLLWNASVGSVGAMKNSFQVPNDRLLVLAIF